MWRGSEANGPAVQPPHDRFLAAAPIPPAALGSPGTFRSASLMPRYAVANPIRDGVPFLGRPDTAQGTAVNRGAAPARLLKDGEDEMRSR